MVSRIGLFDYILLGMEIFVVSFLVNYSYGSNLSDPPLFLGHLALYFMLAYFGSSKEKNERWLGVVFCVTILTFYFIVRMDMSNLFIPIKQWDQYFANGVIGIIFFFFTMTINYIYNRQQKRR